MPYLPQDRLPQEHRFKEMEKAQDDIIESRKKERLGDA